MNELPGFASGAYCFHSLNSRALSALQPQQGERSITPDGSQFFTNSDGDIVYAQYASGAIFSRQANHAAVRTADGDYWLGDSEGRWFRID